MTSGAADFEEERLPLLIGFPNSKIRYSPEKNLTKNCQKNWKKIGIFFQKFENLAREKNAECVDLAKC